MGHAYVLTGTGTEIAQFTNKEDIVGKVEKAVQNLMWVALALGAWLIFFR